MSRRAVVFGYHNVGVRCLAVLLAHGIEVPLVVTHRDDPNERIWFDSVAELAARHDIPVIAPDDANADDVIARVREAAPDYIFSFYYRNVLRMPLLQTASRGAYNLHGSLLPKYRGRVPVNWAVLHGERETGATLHEMTEKIDAGRIVDQYAVPILPDDTAADVFAKVTVASELVLHRALPDLLRGTAQLREQDLRIGAYFGGRKPEDGRIDWSQSATQIHNLVRAVAPPYPGAFADLPGIGQLRVLRTTRANAHLHGPALHAIDGRLILACADGSSLRILEAELDNQPLDAQGWIARVGPQPLPLNTTTS